MTRQTFLASALSSSRFHQRIIEVLNNTLGFASAFNFLVVGFQEFSNATVMFLPFAFDVTDNESNEIPDPFRVLICARKSLLVKCVSNDLEIYQEVHVSPSWRSADCGCSAAQSQGQACRP